MQNRFNPGDVEEVKFSDEDFEEEDDDEDNELESDLEPTPELENNASDNEYLDALDRPQPGSNPSESDLYPSDEEW